ncbi:sulfatase-like hydrolase/transferase [Mesorhizobium sp. BAC0120]|uniref:sulfatase-like hydrolase/transferase n=1 Tax=Mesorhizobium sp. BAC0120 TaxID=3090670 RepID=UPI00298C93BC|nr:sulfatase-like hydrolase/transferase [Mesorhizobium sp. BAC0120]MDW6021624.1 sulfatase-like hydrolase/transferase [Mesorhizobium sp. BAC0120]
MGRNLIILMSDEHGPRSLGVAGHPQVKTPNIDKLAAAGTRFTRAYCTSPICVPARAGFATGLYPHQNHYWDNAFPYDGLVKGWGHRLIEAGHECVSIGKLHYRNDTDDTGFSRQIAPMHVIGGLGDLVGMIRNGPPVRHGARKYIEEAGEGRTAYQQYDETTAKLATEWLGAHADGREGETGWLLFVSFVCPHFPLQAPAEYLALYPEHEIVLPAELPSQDDLHPAILEYARLMNFLPSFTEKQVRRALSAYLALVTFMDAQVGRVLEAVEKLGLAEDTTVIYTSDHGDNMGRNGLFGKSTMYEDSVGVPLIIKGAGIPAGRQISTPVSHVDIHPTVLELIGVSPSAEDQNLPGTSLLAQIEGDQRRYPVLSEYHATCSTGGITMLRQGSLKYVHYVNYPEQLFDLDNDPDELHDLAGDQHYHADLVRMRNTLRELLDPVKVDAAAKAEQEVRIALHGGREAILAGGTLGYTPAPGEKPDIS